ncbi:hypothetical protein [Halorientalis marina]|jgi:uncharacterized paraquat-inducible protein A|uniref:hypothetical protein n=1 Tax=Halorientalis marina TaxID=2931976 RepID=UPI001FF36FC7|nr:hypothetical protein [Halorientalis marina]
MGLFNRLGREVEQFKQTASDAAEENKGPQCPACDAALPADFLDDLPADCPECGTTLEPADDGESND